MHSDNHDKTERLAGVTKALIFDTFRKYKDAKDSYFYAASFGFLAVLVVLGLAFMWIFEYTFIFDEIAFAIFLCVAVLINYIYSWNRLRLAKCTLQDCIFKLESVGITLTLESGPNGNRLQTVIIKPPEVNHLPRVVDAKKRIDKLDWAQFDELIIHNL